MVRLRLLLGWQRRYIQQGQIEALEASTHHIRELIGGVRAYKTVFQAGMRTAVHARDRERFAHTVRKIDADAAELLSLHTHNHALLAQAVEQRSAHIQSSPPPPAVDAPAFPDQVRNILIDAEA